DVPGSSDVYLGGWITYANAMKSGELGVSARMLAEHGAVSAPVAQVLAEQALAQSGADMAASITGIAGPGGGSADKPVGTVLLGLAMGANVTGGPTTRVYHLDLPGTRPAIRDRAAKSALQLLRFAVLGVPLD